MSIHIKWCLLTLKLFIKELSNFKNVSASLKIGNREFILVTIIKGIEFGSKT